MSYSDNPPLARVTRGSWVESQHRGAFVVVDGEGGVLAGAGDFEAPVFARSSTKALQALPLIESGAADRYGFDAADLALIVSSHNAEPQHVERVCSILSRVGLTPEALRCGPARPGDPAARQAALAAGEEPQAVYHNCSGKHAGFLALATSLGEAPDAYIDPESRSQRLVRQAVADMTGLAPDELEVAVDGCSAPTFRLPLVALARAFQRLSNPERLPAARRAACRAMTAAVSAHPELIAGRHGRICTDLARLRGGRLFPKIGAEAVYAIGLNGGGRALAMKIDDGTKRGLGPVLVGLLRRFDFIDDADLAALSAWRAGPLHNAAGLEIGELEVLNPSAEIDS